jgi:hypothetical protein
MSNFRQIVTPNGIIMSFRLPGLCALCLFAAGCSSLPSLPSLHSLVPFDRDPPDPVVVAAAPPAVPAPPPPAQAAAGQPDEWCMRVAANDRAQAAANGFDTATQDRMTVQSYRQCATLKGQ